jgi:hypothetical protein
LKQLKINVCKGPIQIKTTESIVMQYHWKRQGKVIKCCTMYVLKNLMFLNFCGYGRITFSFFHLQAPELACPTGRGYVPFPYPFPGPVKLLHRSPSAVKDFCSAEQCTVYKTTLVSTVHVLLLYCYQRESERSIGYVIFVLPNFRGARFM